MTQRLYAPPSNLEVPGLEAIFEYGDASRYRDGSGIPGAMRINDHELLDGARVTQLDGLHDDPEASESRQANADRHGETSGQMLYRGRTVGLTGRVEAGNIGAMRDNWRRLRGQFGVIERDLLVHHPFEIPALINEWVNPDLSVDGYAWDVPSSTGGGTPGVVTGGVADGNSNVGSATLTSATGAGALRVYGQLIDSTITPYVPRLSKLNGKDVWITARVKVHGATGTVSSIGIGVAQYSGVTDTAFTRAFPTALFAQSSPATGTWYTIAARVLASSLAFDTEYVTPGIVLSFAGAGTYTVHFYRVGLVLVDPEDPTPNAYFSGNFPGFESTGTLNRSASIGPTHARNMIADPRFESFANVAIRTLSKWGDLSSGVTINQAPIRSDRWSGDFVDGALYFKSTKDNTATSRTMGVVALDEAGLDYFPVIESRRYRFSIAVNLLSKPATGSVTASIRWLNEAGTVVLTHDSDPLALGVSGAGEAFVEHTAPANAVAARVLVWNAGTTTALAVLELYLSDPCFVDVTDWDPGDFYGVGDVGEEVDVYRRIPRPFLVQHVRKTSDMKAPEQQSRNRAWRDFTMSLRAGDPRIYCFDERRRSLRLGSVALLSFVVATGTSFTTEVTPPPVPTGFTYEGNTGTTSVEWSELVASPTSPGVS